MKKGLFGFVSDGERRMREAIKVEVRNEYKEKLSATTGYWERAAIEGEMCREVRRRMKQVASPHSLWVSG